MGLPASLGRGRRTRRRRGRRAHNGNVRWERRYRDGERPHTRNVSRHRRYPQRQEHTGDPTVCCGRHPGLMTEAGRPASPPARQLLIGGRGTAGQVGRTLSVPRAVLECVGGEVREPYRSMPRSCLNGSQRLLNRVAVLELLGWRMGGMFIPCRDHFVSSLTSFGSPASVAPGVRSRVGGDLALRGRPGNVLRAGRETGEASGSGNTDTQRPSCQTPEDRVPRGIVYSSAGSSSFCGC
jgi:hypothetical protein